MIMNLLKEGHVAEMGNRRVGDGVDVSETGLESQENDHITQSILARQKVLFLHKGI